MHIASLKSLIIKETEDYIFINKPPFLSTLADRTEAITILSLAKAHDGDIQICHRLDKETSGVLLLAKNAEAYRNAAIQFEKRKIKKVYHAIADGIHDFRQEVVNLPLHTTSSGYVKISHKRGKVAKTESGRMHQIRVHLAALKASITGDEQYGGKPLMLSAIKSKYNAGKGEEEQPVIKRFALHARTLTLSGMDGELLSCEAPYPKDFGVALKQLGKNRN
jgi:23S rRNA pseudouridine955/2504/2580 synthase